MLRLARSIVSTEASAAEVVQERGSRRSGARRVRGRSSLRTGSTGSWSTRQSAGDPGTTRGPVEQPGAERRADRRPDAFQAAGEPWPGPGAPSRAVARAGTARCRVPRRRCRVSDVCRRSSGRSTLRVIEGCTGPETCAARAERGQPAGLLHRARARLRRMDEHGPERAVVRKEAGHDAGCRPPRARLSSSASPAATRRAVRRTGRGAGFAPRDLPGMQGVLSRGA